MIFAELPIDQCNGAFLAHAVRTLDGVFKKGRLLGQAEIERLRAAGVTKVMAARLESGDIGENQAATRLAEAMLAPGIRAEDAFTGRVNLFSTVDGILRVEANIVNAVNAVDEAITVASVADWSNVTTGQMVATIKIIPFAVPQTVLSRCLDAAKSKAPVLSVLPYRSRPVLLIQTILPTLKPNVAAKTLEITNRRLAELGCGPATEIRCAHVAAELGAALFQAIKSGAELVMVMGASAITDRRDVIPAAIAAAGGHVEQFGMPVDPGNLLLLARIGSTPVLGLPGCARSPKQNGFDWVLQRLLADVAVDANDLRQMGVGGLLMEIPSRPQPRAGRPSSPGQSYRIAGIVLAAGKSSRMGENKLLLADSGVPIIARTVDHALEAGLAEVVVVVGHQLGDVRDALAGRNVRFTEAADFALGMSASLKAGIEAVSGEVDAAIVMLGDMPRVGPGLLRKLIAAYRPAEGKAIVVPVHDGKRGNPVLWDRRYFAAMRALSGDVGARHLIGEHAENVVEVETSNELTFLDVDTPEAYSRLLKLTPA